jgi:hypothetical protein
MNPRIVIDLEFVKAVLAEMDVRGSLEAISGGECRLECRQDKASMYAARIALIGFEVLSNNRQNSSTAVLYFRVMGLKS